jgi:hypothetical protein
MWCHQNTHACAETSWCNIPFLCLQGNGVIVGLGICGVVINATSSAATLMGDFRTGYICLAAPRAMFGAQLVGQLLGALITPMAFMLFYRTGQVGCRLVMFYFVCCIRAAAANQSLLIRKCTACAAAMLRCLWLECQLNMHNCKAWCKQVDMLPNCPVLLCCR